MDLEFNVVNQSLSLNDNDYVLVDKSNNYLNILIDYTTEEWDNAIKYVLLKNKQKEAFLFEYSNTGVKVPSKVLTGNNFRIMTYGVSEDNIRVTTNELLIRLNKSGFTSEISSINDEDIDIDIFTSMELKLAEKVSFSDVDDELNVNSNNPVSNSAVTTAFDSMGNIIEETSELKIKHAFAYLNNIM